MATRLTPMPGSRPPSVSLLAATAAAGQVPPSQPLLCSLLWSRRWDSF